MKRTKHGESIIIGDSVNKSIHKNFTNLPNEIIRSSEMSAKAKIVLAIGLSNKDGWASYQSTILTMMKEGEKAVSNALKELQQFGYMQKIRYRNMQTKQMGGSFWMYTDTPYEFEPLDDIIDKLAEQGMEIFPADLHLFHPGGNLPDGNLPDGNHGLRILNKEYQNNNTNSSSEEEDENSNQEKKITSSMFENFWLLYPRKIDKGKAKTKWEKMCNKPTKERPTWNEIESAIKVQINTTRWQDPKYIPHPTTWLNNQRWLDDPAEMGGAFNDAPSSSTPTNKPLTTQSPRRMIKEHFPKDLAKAFYHDCYSPAKELLANDEGIPLNTEKLTRCLISFHDQIKVEQGKNFTDELRLLLPGPIDLIQGYITWIEDRDWITNISINLFDITNTLFRRFCRDEARKDNMERNPLTGRSYMRG